MILYLFWKKRSNYGKQEIIYAQYFSVFNKIRKFLSNTVFILENVKRDSFWDARRMNAVLARRIAIWLGSSAHGQKPTLIYDRKTEAEKLSGVKHLIHKSQRVTTDHLFLILLFIVMGGSGKLVKRLKALGRNRIRHRCSCCCFATTGNVIQTRGEAAAHVVEDIVVV